MTHWEHGLRIEKTSPDRDVLVSAMQDVKSLIRSHATPSTSAVAVSVTVMMTAPANYRDDYVEAIEDNRSWFKSGTHVTTITTHSTINDIDSSVVTDDHHKISISVS